MKLEILVRFLSALEAEFAPLRPIEVERERILNMGVKQAQSANWKKRLEARVGIEPTHKGFADLSLTTWVPRPAI